MQYFDLPTLRDVLPGIASRADRTDQSGEWPAEDLRVLAGIGAMRWSAPMSCGGEDLSPIELHFRYEAIASASLTAALILSQRDSAVAMITETANKPLADELLPKLANNAIFATIGIAQLTTSRQGGIPALSAVRVDGGWRLNGYIPWSTGAEQSAYVIAGAPVVGDGGRAGEQILFALPTDLRGVMVEPALQLVALRASRTSTVRCEDVMLEDRWLLAGPTPRVLSGRKKTLPLGQAFLAMGLCRGAIDLIRAHSSAPAETAATAFERQLSDVRTAVMDASGPDQPPDPSAGPRLRGRCNDLAVRATHAAVAIYKGTALLMDHPAQRLAREAMFLLVWSCPNPVIDCTVELLSAGPDA